MASQLAIETGLCLCVGGGLHHAGRDEGRGFCLLNDVAVAAETAVKQKRARWPTQASYCCFCCFCCCVCLSLFVWVPLLLLLLLLRLLLLLLLSWQEGVSRRCRRSSGRRHRRDFQGKEGCGYAVYTLQRELSSKETAVFIIH